MLQSKSKYYTLDILKATAIIGVIAVHFNNYVQAPNHVLARFVGIIGPTCPQLFFIISAFLLFKTIGKFDFTTSQGISKFFAVKFKRILPLYFIMVAVYTILNASTPPY